MIAVVLSTEFRPAFGDQLATVSIRDDKDNEIAVRQIAMPIDPSDGVIDNYLLAVLLRYTKEPSKSKGTDITGKTFEAVALQADAEEVIP